MIGSNEWLTSTNDALKGYPYLRLWLITRIDACICTTNYAYQIYIEIMNVTPQTWNNINASLNY
jgi:hypothetical protein